MVSYWLDLFTGTTWEEFQAAGATISGFRGTKAATVAKIQKGDILLCYLTGVMRWVGALEVVGPVKDERAIWTFDQFPERLLVKPLILLSAENGVPMNALRGKVAFYQSDADRGGFKGFLRGSPMRFSSDADAELILSFLEDARDNPILRPVDQKKLKRKPRYRVKTPGPEADTRMVMIPERDETETPSVPVPLVPTPEVPATLHTEIQYYLLRLGSDMGLDIWAARNDRSRSFNGELFSSMPGMVNLLPTQFNEATQRTIELIDVLWLKGNSIIAAFEVESTTSVYSGLLRMSDLIALQPNLDIKLYLIADKDRREKVRQEIMRPTFELLQKPLSKVCGFIAFDTLRRKVKGIQDLGLASSIKPEFLEGIAEYFGKDYAR
jgi:hypothetical protein